MPKLLIDESPLVVLPSLVKAVGLERAIILQQIHYLCQSPKGGKILDDGRKWTWHTYDEMVLEYFPFWSAKTLQYHILKLEKEGFLLSCQPRQTDWDTTKFYRLCDSFLGNFSDAQPSSALAPRPSNVLDPHLKDTKTTTKTTYAAGFKSEIDSVFNHWRDTFHPKAKLDKKRSTTLKARFAEGATLEEMMMVVDGVKYSSYHIQNKYTGIATIYRDREQVEKFAQLAEENKNKTADGKTLHGTGTDYAKLHADEIQAQANAHLTQLLKTNGHHATTI